LLRKIFFLIVPGLLAIFFSSCSENTYRTPTDGDNRPFFYSHTQQAGTAAIDFLSDTNFAHLLIEVDHMPGYAPNREALDSLKAFMEQRLHKSTVTIKDPTVINSRNQQRYSAEQIRQIEQEERSTFSREDTLAAYMIIVDGKYQEQNLLGIAYFNTSNAFFGPSYEEVSSGIGPPSRFQIEALSFRHEFGHTFGLVNIPNSGTEMQMPHQDTENGHHCDNENCLMYYATERADLIAGTLSGDEIPGLDANCLADLEANGSK
jgi:predicted Zn-dependent protease